jgi:hypothetical protein
MSYLLDVIENGHYRAEEVGAVRALLEIVFEAQERTKGAIGGSNDFEKQLKATTAATSRMREPAERVS